MFRQSDAFSVLDKSPFKEMRKKRVQKYPFWLNLGHFWRISPVLKLPVGMVGASETALKFDFFLYFIPLLSPSFPSCWSPGDSLLNCPVCQTPCQILHPGKPSPLPLSKIREKMAELKFISVDNKVHLENLYTKSIWPVWPMWLMLQNYSS